MATTNFFVLLSTSESGIHVKDKLPGKNRRRIIAPSLPGFAQCHSLQYHPLGVITTLLHMGDTLQLMDFTWPSPGCSQLADSGSTLGVGNRKWEAGCSLLLGITTLWTKTGRKRCSPLGSPGYWCFAFPVRGCSIYETISWRHRVFYITFCPFRNYRDACQELSHWKKYVTLASKFLIV